MDENCVICGGDKDAGALARLLGYRPDVAWLEVKRLRRIWWRDHKCKNPYLYGDDGEMQCNGCLADFKRHTVDQIEAAIKDSFRE